MKSAPLQTSKKIGPGYLLEAPWQFTFKQRLAMLGCLGDLRLMNLFETVVDGAARNEESIATVDLHSDRSRLAQSSNAEALDNFTYGDSIRLTPGADGWH